MTPTDTLTSLVRHLRHVWRHDPVSAGICLLSCLLTVGMLLITIHFTAQIRVQVRQIQTQALSIAQQRDVAMRQRDEAMTGKEVILDKLRQAVDGWQKASDERDALVIMLEQQHLLLNQCPGLVPEWHL